LYQGVNVPFTTHLRKGDFNFPKSWIEIKIPHK